MKAPSLRDRIGVLGAALVGFACVACSEAASGGDASKEFGTESSREALIGAPALPNRRFAVGLVDMIDSGPGSGPEWVEEARRWLLGTNPQDASVKRNYKEGSYGVQDISVEFFGPLSYQRTRSQL